MYRLICPLIAGLTTLIAGILPFIAGLATLTPGTADAHHSIAAVYHTRRETRSKASSWSFISSDRIRT